MYNQAGCAVKNIIITFELLSWSLKRSLVLFETILKSRTSLQLKCLLPLQSLYLVVLDAVLVLVQSDALPVQDPVMTFPLGEDETKI